MFPDSFILYAYTAMGLSLTFSVVVADAVRYGRRIDEPSTARTVRVGLVCDVVRAGTGKPDIEVSLCETNIYHTRYSLCLTLVNWTTLTLSPTSQRKLLSRTRHLSRIQVTRLSTATMSKIRHDAPIFTPRSTSPPSPPLADHMPPISSEMVFDVFRQHVHTHAAIVGIAVSGSSGLLRL